MIILGQVANFDSGKGSDAILLAVGNDVKEMNAGAKVRDVTWEFLRKRKPTEAGMKHLKKFLESCGVTFHRPLDLEVYRLPPEQ